MAIIRKLTLKRFKGFSDFEIELGKFTVLVGENGAGKTTILEALYMAQLAFRRVFGGKDQPQIESPNWGFSFRDVLHFGISAAKAEDLWFHRQLDQPLELVVDYDNGLSYRLNSHQVDFLGTRLVDTTGKDLSASPATADTREHLKSIYSLVPELLRPVGALQAPEGHMDFDSLERQKTQGHLTAVWRNFVFWQYNFDTSGFRVATTKLKDRIPWAEILEPRLSRVDDSVQILFKQDKDVYDIASGGGGLSTVLSVSLVSELGGAKLILLDEPDAHLHSSLQAKVAKSLYDLAQEGGRQMVLATHAPDFIDAVPVECIRWVDRRDSTATRTTSATRLLERLGALTKVQALQLRGVKVILWLEGKTDLEILQKLAAKAHKEAIFSNPLLEWAINLKEGHEDKVGELQQLIRTMFQIDVRIVAVRDADYGRLVEEAPRKLRDKQDNGARVFVLGRKEIENYLLDPATISLAYKAKMKVNNAEPKSPPTQEDVRAAVRRWAETPVLRDMLRYKFTAQVQVSLPTEWTRETKLAEAEKRFEKLFQDETWLYESVSGKEALRALNDAFREPTGVELSVLDICEHLSIPPDILTILEAVEQALAASAKGETSDV